MNFTDLVKLVRAKYGVSYDQAAKMIDEAIEPTIKQRIDEIIDLYNF